MKPYTSWGKPMKIISSVAFWLPVQLLFIIVIESFGLLPSNLSPDKCGFGGPKGFFVNLDYTCACCCIGFIYTLVGSILVSHIGLGGRKFWIWFASLYVLYLIVTLVGMMQAEGAWFFDGFGCYIFDVWMAPLLWLGELFLGKCINNRKHDRLENAYNITVNGN